MKGLGELPLFIDRVWKPHLLLGRFTASPCFVNNSKKKHEKTAAQPQPLESHGCAASMLERESHSQVSSVFTSRLSWPAVQCCISAKRGMMKPLATAVAAPSLPKRPPVLS